MLYLEVLKSSLVPSKRGLISLPSRSIIPNVEPFLLYPRQLLCIVLSLSSHSLFLTPFLYQNSRCACCKKSMRNRTRRSGRNGKTRARVEWKVKNGVGRGLRNQMRISYRTQDPDSTLGSILLGAVVQSQGPIPLIFESNCAVSIFSSFFRPAGKKGGRKEGSDIIIKSVR